MIKLNILYLNVVTAILIFLFSYGCSKVRESAGATRKSPNEFQAIENPPLVIPPDYRESHENSKLSNKHLPYVRFPQWHRCPACGLMEFI